MVYLFDSPTISIIDNFGIHKHLTGQEAICPGPQSCSTCASVWCLWKSLEIDLPFSNHTKNHGASPFSMGQPAISAVASIVNCSVTRLLQVAGVW